MFGNINCEEFFCGSMRRVYETIVAAGRREKKCGVFVVKYSHCATDQSPLVFGDINCEEFFCVRKRCASMKPC